MVRIFLGIAAIFGSLSVAAGAFASHALKEKLSERAIGLTKSSFVSNTGSISISLRVTSTT